MLCSVISQFTGNWYCWAIFYVWYVCPALVAETHLPLGQLSAVVYFACFRLGLVPVLVSHSWAVGLMLQLSDQPFGRCRNIKQQGIFFYVVPWEVFLGIQGLQSCELSAPNLALRLQLDWCSWLPSHSQGRNHFGMCWPLSGQLIHCEDCGTALDRLQMLEGADPQENAGTRYVVPTRSAQVHYVRRPVATLEKLLLKLWQRGRVLRSACGQGALSTS